ncbi:unnamed protein product [Rotaria sp. Silwood1]|nr:unnamed protein product [Rotaria sp. Silwood1]
MPSVRTIYLWLTVVLPWFSSLLYLLVPGGTIKYFGGVPTPSAKFWVQVVASGDIVIGFLALAGLKTRNSQVLQLIFQAIGVYNIFHMSTFWFNHLFREAHPAGPSFYISALIISSIACGYWGWWNPYQFDSEHIKTKIKF